MLITEIRKIFDGKNLSLEESYQVIEKIASEEVPEVQIATLLTLLTQRHPTVEELVGFAQGMRDHTITIGEWEGSLLDTCGTGGDEQQTFNVSTLSSLVLSAFGITTAKHGNRSITSQCGSADLLEGLGVNLELSLDRILPCLKEVGMAFFFAPRFHPVMKILGPIRKHIGIPTLFNSMGPLLNPIRADYQVMGLYYTDTEKIAKVLQSLNVKGGMVVHSHDGMDEISPCAPTRVTEFTTKSFRTYDFDPRDFGFTFVSGSEVQGGDLDTNIAIAREVLSPQVSMNARKQFVILNVAAGIKTVKGWDFKEALQAAKDTLQSGAAEKKLEELINFTHR